eukprot:7224017-Alexandrium_andersonii.AAC.1
MLAPALQWPLSVSMHCVLAQTSILCLPQLASGAEKDAHTVPVNQHPCAKVVLAHTLRRVSNPCVRARRVVPAQHKLVRRTFASTEGEGNASALPHVPSTTCAAALKAAASHGVQAHKAPMLHASHIATDCSSLPAAGLVTGRNTICLAATETPAPTGRTKDYAHNGDVVARSVVDMLLPAMPSPALHAGVPTHVQADTAPMLHARISHGHNATARPGWPVSEAFYLLLLLDWELARLLFSTRAAAATVWPSAGVSAAPPVSPVRLPSDPAGPVLALWPAA